MLFRHAHENESEVILALYEDAKKDPLCVWNEYYPTMEEIRHDLAAESLYVLEDDDGELIGALSVVPENELDDMPQWKTNENAAEIARITVKSTHRGHHFAAFMVKEIIEALREDIYFAIHLSVAKTNLPAVKTYQKLGFITVGEADMWDNSYYLMEKTL